MNRKSPYTPEAALTLIAISQALKIARRSRKETIEQAACRLSISASSVKRFESQDPELVASVSAGALMTALCSVGYTNALTTAFKPSEDAHGDFLRQRAVMKSKK